MEQGSRLAHWGEKKGVEWEWVGGSGLMGVGRWVVWLIGWVAL